MVKGLFSVKVWTGAVVATAMTATMSAQQPQQPQQPTTPTAINVQQTTTTPPQSAPGANLPQATPVDPYVVGQAKPPVLPGQTQTDLTLDSAIQMALEKNLGLQAAKLNPSIQDYALQAARAPYHPSLNGSYGYSASSRTATSQVDCATRLTSSSNSYSSGLSQSLPWYGSSMSASFTSSRSATNDSCSTRNPNLNSNLSVSFTQPLLQNLKIDNTRNTLRTAQITREVTDITLQTTVENLRSQVRTAYWNLRQAIEQIEIAKKNLELNQKVADDNKTRVEIGTMAPIDTTQADVQVANGEQTLLAAENSWRTAELNFKQLLAGGPDDPIYTTTINPTDVPTFANQDLNIPAAVTAALSQRLDLISSRKNLQISELNLELNKNALLPNLSLQASYRLAGTGGPQIIRSGFGSDQVTSLIPGGYPDALRSLFGIGDLASTPSWSMTFNFSYPLGQISQRASYAQAELRIKQSQATLKQQELSVYAGVTNAGLQVQNAFKSLAAARKSREAAEQNANAAQVRFDVGMANQNDIATAFNNLLSSRLSELSAIIRYVNAVAEYDRIQKIQ